MPIKYNRSLSCLAGIETAFVYDDGVLRNRVQRNSRALLGGVAGFVNNAGYRAVSFRYKQLLVHRIVFAMHCGYLPEMIDHIDGNKLNNRIENLRACNISQNIMNTKKRSGKSSVYKGVSFARSRNTAPWQAAVKKDGRQIYLGYFDDEKSAAVAYDIAALRYHGEFAVLNFPSHYEQKRRLVAANK